MIENLVRIPLIKNKKDPIPKKWQTDEYIPNEEKIREHVLSGGNIGYRTGGKCGLFVCDFDDEHSEGALRMRELFGPYLDATPTNITKKGWHNIFLRPRKLEKFQTRSSKGRILEGVDILCDVGFFVAPPSVVLHEDGVVHKYYWKDERNTVLNAVVPELPVEMLEFFEALVRKKTGVSIIVPDSVDDDDFPACPTPQQKAFVITSAFASLDGSETIEEGTRDCTMASIAGEIIVRYGVTDPDFVAEKLSAVNESRCNPPLPDSDIRRIAKSVCGIDRKNNPEREPRPMVDDADFAASEESAPKVEISIPRASDECFDAAYDEFLDAPRPKPKEDGPNACAKWMLANIFRPGLLLLGEQYVLRDGVDHVWHEVPKTHVTAAIQGAFDSKRADTEGIEYSVRNLVYCALADYPFWYGAKRTSVPPGYPPSRDIISFKNGLLDVNTMTLLPHNPRLVSLSQTPFGYDPTARCDHWVAFLRDLWGWEQGLNGRRLESDRAKALRYFFGYCLTPDTSQHKIGVIHGVRRGGKSTIAKILHSLVGDHSTAVSTLSSLATTHGMSPLVGKLLTIFYDAHLPAGTSHGSTIEMLKSLGAGDPQPVNRKYQDQYSAHLCCRLLIVCNEIPRIEDAGNALAGRLIPIRCEKTFYGAEDTRLLEKLTLELPGIANWALSGLRDYRKDGRLVMPKSGIEDLSTLQRATNPVEAFLEDACTIDSDASVPARDLFVEWTAWCQETNYRGVGTQMRFLDKIRSVSSEIHIRRIGMADKVMGVRLNNKVTTV